VLIALSLVVGFAGGVAFHFLWRKILPRDLSRNFWRAVPTHASGLVNSEDPDDVMRHYGSLMKQIGRFAARNTLGVLAGLAPVAALFILSDELYGQERSVPVVEVRPARAVAGAFAAVPTQQTRDGGILIDSASLTREFHLFGEALDREALGSKHAFCHGWLACLGYDLMLFKTHSLPSPPLNLSSDSVVIRPRVFAANPFWPYIDDLELAFFGGIMAGSIAAAWRASRSKVAAP
jgi:hypothetical protein